MNMKLRKSKIWIRLKRILNNEYDRIEWVQNQLEKIEKGSKILDAGCGSQQYRKFCGHLIYYAQDFGKYEIDKADSFTASEEKYKYGKIDYVGDIWDIKEKDDTFDAILCTEVLEHIPYPEKTLWEFARLLKPGGILILTFPSNSLRHMDPYYFASGYSDRYIEYFLPKMGLEIEQLNPNGNYYKWLMVELYRTMSINGFISFVILFPSFIYLYFKQKNPSKKAIATLGHGYHVLAKKR